MKEIIWVSTKVKNLLKCSWPHSEGINLTQEKPTGETASHHWQSAEKKIEEKKGNRENNYQM